jgi:hypothetical protein
VAIVAEGCFFALLDPRELFHADSRYALPPIAGYTIGFFFFWTFCALASMLTYFLANVSNDRRPPF